MNIEIEFCIKWHYDPEFDRVSTLIKEIVPEAIIKGNLVSPRSGAFEIKINNKIFFSKLSTNRFPTKNEIISWFE